LGKPNLGSIELGPERDLGINYLVCICSICTRFLRLDRSTLSVYCFFRFFIFGCYLGVNLLGKGLHSYGFLVSYSRNIVILTLVEFTMLFGYHKLKVVLVI
jgi:hypothetical protein